MQTSTAGRALIKRSEGLRLRTYSDIAGIATIGFGHRLQPGELYPQGITLEKANALFEADVFCAERSVTRLVHVALTQGQFDALVDFVFNLGAGRLQSSTLLAELNAGRYDAAASQLLAWDHVGSVEVTQLKKRREAEFNLWTGKAA